MQRHRLGAGVIVALVALSLPSYAADPLETSFEQQIKPFFKKNCMLCHSSDTGTAGIRVDQLNANLEDRHIRVWEAIRHRLSEGTMPPKGMPQPSSAERQQIVDWITHALDIARSRPSPKNGLVRRLTIAQYRNTLRDLLLIEDDVTEGLPPDAVSRDGFVNNKDTLQMSPLLMEAYLETAEEALKRSIGNVKAKPSIQSFRVDLGASVNPAPLQENLILGADSMLLENKDFMVTQLVPKKPFAFEPFMMRSKYRFIEGYQGNDTVRDWREFNSIYHAVFACMRGSKGYPKGLPYDAVKQGLLLRPAIPNEEMFDNDGTYGPKANFKISLRELPDYGRFRVTVTAAKYNDGLLLDSGATAAAQTSAAVQTARSPKVSQTVAIKQSGIYQVDIYPSTKPYVAPPADSTRLSQGLASSWTFDNPITGAKIEGNPKCVDSPFGKALSFDGTGDLVSLPRQESTNVVAGDFTVAAWIHPRELKQLGIAAYRGPISGQGWSLDMPGKEGVLRFEVSALDGSSNGTATSVKGAIRAGAWQHVAAVVNRNKHEMHLYLNGFPVARAKVGLADLDNLKGNLYLGRSGDGSKFQGEMDEVRLYRRALSEAELQALIQPGQRFVQAPPAENLRLVNLSMGDREFSGTLMQPAFLAVRLPAGPLTIRAEHAGITELDHITLTPLSNDSQLAQRFVTFEKRSPRLGVHLGLRRDCGSTLAQVGGPQTVSSEKLTRFIFEGAIRNFPSPEVEKNNVNYLAGFHEIGVRSEYTDGRDMPRLLIRSVEFEGPFYDSWPPASYKNIFIDSAHKNDSATYAREIIHSFAARAYRRPVTRGEEAALFGVYQKSAAAGRCFEDSIKDALEVALTSPQFLFLVENSPSPAAEPLDDYELSSKLSYFLWNGPPDRTTLHLAETGTLRKHLDSEVERLIADRRFSQFAREFTSQWLSLDKFQVLEPDRKRYPKLTRIARTQLRQEPIQFVEYLIRNNLPARNLISSDFVVANETVANYYDLGDKTENGFQFVAIPHGRPELGGVLTQAAIMAGLSDGRESNPVKRGAWVARKIIAEPPNDPPPNVPALKAETANLTLRERLEQHRNQSACAQCHAKIDPWGVAFEQFDAGGRLKLQPVDAHSILPDKTAISGANDLKRYLTEDRMDQVAFSVLKHLATYASGRTLTYNELTTLKQDGLQLKANGYRMQDMVRFVVNSELFLEK